MATKQAARPSATVISLATIRTARTERQAPAPASVASADPYEVMECMIEGYFRALSMQMEKLNAERRKA